MGRGNIISGGTGGLYTVELEFNNQSILFYIQQVQVAIDRLNALIPTLEEGSRARNIAVLQKLSFEKRIQLLNARLPSNETVTAWCADLTEDLSGQVATLEIPGEKGIVQIAPGFFDNAAWTPQDGLLKSTMAQNPPQAYYNLALLPAWQKWRPTYRHGSITRLDGDICDLTVDTTASSQQGLNINQTPTLENVNIEYMTCNGAAFEVGDSVLIEFMQQDWAQPKVIGFKDSPRPCIGLFIIITFGAYVTVWDVENNQVADSATNNQGDPVVFPALADDIVDWASQFKVVGSNSFTDKLGFRQVTGTFLDSTVTSTPTSNPNIRCINIVSTSNNQPPPYELVDNLGEEEQQPEWTGSGNACSDNITRERSGTSTATLLAPTGGQGLPTPILRSVQNFPNRERSFALQVETHIDYEEYFCANRGEPLCCGPACKSLDVFSQVYFERNTYTLKSPFSDLSEYEWTATIESQWESSISRTTGTGPCDPICEQELSNTPEIEYNAKYGRLNDKVQYSFAFYAAKGTKDNTVYDGICGYNSPPFGGRNQLSSCQLANPSNQTAFNNWYEQCNLPGERTVVETLPITIKGFIEKAPDGVEPRTLNPYELPENVDMGAAILDLYNTAMTAHPDTPFIFESDFLTFI